MIKNIIFDFDGVIIDSIDIKTDAFLELYKEYGENIQKQIYKYHIENLGIDRFKKIKYFHNNFLNITINNEELNKLATIFSLNVFKKIIKCQFIEGAREFLENNKNDYSLFISSGTPQEELENIIRLKNINEYFIDIYGSPLTKNQHVKNIKDKYNILDNETLFIGDASIDQKTAKNNNLYFIGIESNSNLFDEEKYKMLNLKNLNEMINRINLDIK